MTPLRRKMIEDMRLAGLTSSTQQVYVQAIATMARRLGKGPQQMSEEELRQYFVYLTTQRKVSRSSWKVAICATKFLFEHTLCQPWPTLRMVRPARERKLPVVLSRTEVWKILDQVSDPVIGGCLTMLYCCGLRVGEGRHLAVGDIDRSRMLIRVRGKGNKERNVPLGRAALPLLERSWKVHRHPHWVFATGWGAKSRSDWAQKGLPIGPRALAHALREACQRAGIRKRVHLHTLRHCYATHLMEAAVPLPAIQQYLGHRSLNSTALYTHLTSAVEAGVLDPIDQLLKRPR